MILNKASTSSYHKELLNYKFINLIIRSVGRQRYTIHVHKYYNNKITIEFKEHNDAISINDVLLEVWYKLMIGFQSVHKN
jgi:hypothetical protein